MSRKKGAQRQNTASYKRDARLAQAIWSFGLIYTAPEQVQTVLIHNIAVLFLGDKNTYWKISKKWITAHWHTNPLCQEEGEEMKDLALPDSHQPGLPFHKAFFHWAMSTRFFVQKKIKRTKKNQLTIHWGGFRKNYSLTKSVTITVVLLGPKEGSDHRVSVSRITTT